MYKYCITRDIWIWQWLDMKRQKYLCGKAKNIWNNYSISLNIHRIYIDLSTKSAAFMIQVSNKGMTTSAVLWHHYCNKNSTKSHAFRAYNITMAYLWRKRPSNYVLSSLKTSAWSICQFWGCSTLPSRDYWIRRRRRWRTATHCSQPHLQNIADIGDRFQCSYTEQDFVAMRL